MSYEIPAHTQTQFEMNWEQRLQRKISKLLPFVKTVEVQGDRRRFSQLGEGDMSLITGRNQATQIDDSDTYVRWLQPYKFQRTTLIDEWDDVELGNLPAPTGDHMTQHVFAYNRQRDTTIRDAIEGNALTGEDGTTLVAQDKTIAHNSETLTLAKVAEAKLYLDNNELDEAGRCFAVSPNSEQQLVVNVIEVKSSDYLNATVIRDGSVDGKTWMGFNWVCFTGLTVASNIRNNLAWHKDYVRFGDGQRRATIDVLPTVSHSIQCRTRARMGAMRVEEKGSLIIQSDESSITA